jgi:hypothetical protein
MLNIGNSAYSSNEKVYKESEVPGPEYRVRMVSRYVVTRYCFPYVSDDGTHGSTGSSEVIGEFASEQRAFDVAHAMAASDGNMATVST